MQLSDLAETLAATIMGAIVQEYPNAMHHVMRDAEDRPRPREAHPAFYGCFDWHSAVEMHWALAVLVARYPEAAFVPAADALLREQLSAANLAAETDYLIANPSFERPYGWGWLLALTDALEADPRLAPCAAHVRPLADLITARFVEWLPIPAYPNRTGLHGNSAFALARALPQARRRADAGAPSLLEAITAACLRWYGQDIAEPRHEPGGSDFLSPTLAEAVLMQEVLQPAEFSLWCSRFLPEGVPSVLTLPALVTDAEDGQGAHLHGLNLYRVHAFTRLLAGPGPLDPVALADARDRHVASCAAALAAPGWMATHWLAAYAVLAFDLV